MIGNLNHVAIAVPDLAAAANLYRDAFGARVSAPLALPEHGVTTVFVELPNAKIELLHPLGEASPIAKFLEKNPAGGIHHLCYEVDDIEHARQRLADLGIRVLGDGKAKTGAHGKPVIFVHPKDATGALIELEQAGGLYDSGATLKPEIDEPDVDRLDVDKLDIDKLYADPLPRVVDFVFDARVAEAFPDMIRRSVPGYENILSLLGVIAERYAQADSNVYDLGCSLGASMLSMHARIADRSVRFIGVDNSAPMLQKCRANLDGIIDAKRFDLVQCDVMQAEVKDACMVVLNFTLQFVEPAERLDLLRRIYAGLKPGGGVVVSEKIRIEDNWDGRLQQTLHEQFKAANGYSELEIAQKRTALEKVMKPDSAATHLARLRQAGFAHAGQWFQAFNFCSFVAHK